VRLIKDKFVPLAVDGRIINYCNDTETEFLAKPTICVANSASGGAYVVAANGKRLERGELHQGKGIFGRSLERGLKAFAALPASERDPGAVQIPERGPIDPKRVVALGPPPGGLVVRVWNRQLGRTDKGELRHTAPEDYNPHLRDAKAMGPPGATALFTQPANDFMWITEGEAKAMMPAEPREGQTIAVPDALSLRIFRFHLDPGRGFTESDAFPNATLSAGKLHLTVESVTRSEVRLRLEGIAELHNPRKHLLTYQSPGVKEKSKSQTALEYHPRLLGYFAYEPAKRIVTRFDMVALGETRGRPVDSNLFGERLNDPNLQGIAFELVRDPRPADFVPPKGLNGGRYDLGRYLGKAKEQE
jgi:hypothetical protein